jgi:hypothetical protein
LELVKLADLNALTHPGIVEFLDDLCPCGENHTQEAVRKLRTRKPKH